MTTYGRWYPDRRPPRAWVCIHCETGGRSPRPLYCWWCGRQAIDAGPGHWLIDAAFITGAISRHLR